ncbi:MAG: flagellin lysine-N-methylase [Clostridia bacterium]|nr:flagellin lysine-N-methylase [Clostridia bacterium]
MEKDTLIAPSYYASFGCIGGACRHSCCVGWEIDIDEQTLALYEGMEGALGDRLRRSVCYDGTPHFALSEGERCPHLNREGLCDVILEAGEGALCQICADHPRFYHEGAYGCEVGLGLCCEAAAELILSRQDPVTLVRQDGTPLVMRPSYRNTLFQILQNRTQTVPMRMRLLLALAGGGEMPSLGGLYDEVFSQMEYMDVPHTPRLLRDACHRYENAATWQGQEALFGEQLLHYFIYRYVTPGLRREARCAATRFSVTSVRVIAALAYLMAEGAPRLCDWVEAARLYSSEIEYSLDNVKQLMQARYI